jgi:hypothetical protein
MSSHHQREYDLVQNEIRRKISVMCSEGAFLAVIGCFWPLPVIATSK